MMALTKFIYSAFIRTIILRMGGDDIFFCIHFCEAFLPDDLVFLNFETK